MACHIERTRLYLDDYIYPRDLSLNLLDVLVDENLVDLKGSHHLTERMYSIEYKDLFLAYERCKQLDESIRRMEGVDVEKGSIMKRGKSIAFQKDIEKEEDGNATANGE